MPRSFLGGLLLHWLENYDDVLKAAVSLLYAQILVNLVGTLSAELTGLLDADVAVALFGLVAIASGYQTLGRTYAGLLGFMLLLDSCWLILFSASLWSTVESHGVETKEGLTAGLVLGASALGFILRVLSALLWAQMFRLGWAASDAYEANPGASPFLNFPEFDQSSRGRTSADHSPGFTRQASHSDEFLGSSIFHPPSFAALVHPGHLNDYLRDDAISCSQASNDSAYEPPEKIPEEHEDFDQTEGKGSVRSPGPQPHHVDVPSGLP